MEKTSGEPREVDAVDIEDGMTVDELVSELSGAGFGAGNLADAVDVASGMMADEDTTVFLSIAGAMVPAGMKNVFIEFIQRGYVDVIVTTGANIVHDAVEALGGHHYHGSNEMDDEELHRRGIDRIYDVYLEEEMFTELEGHVYDVLSTLPEKTSIQGVTQALGESLETGWLANAAEEGVPVYCPAFQDSVVGLQTWTYAQTHNLVVDAFADMDGLIDICYDSTRSGAFIVGGGVPKNFTLQSMLVAPTTFNYAVQLTMDTEHTGGLSGATLDEAKSWGKLEEGGRNVTVYGDATINLPVIACAVLDRVG